MWEQHFLLGHIYDAIVTGQQKSPQVQLTWNHTETKLPYYQPVKIFCPLGYYSACILYRHIYYLCIFYIVE